jgi:hypothetical protein
MALSRQKGSGIDLLLSIGGYRLRCSLGILCTRLVDRMGHRGKVCSYGYFGNRPIPQFWSLKGVSSAILEVIFSKICTVAVFVA